MSRAQAYATLKASVCLCLLDGIQGDGDAANGTKYFATADLLEIAKDRAWLVKMTTAINQHWQKQNSRKKSPLNGAQNGHSRTLDLVEVDGER